MREYVLGLMKHQTSYAVVLKTRGPVCLHGKYNGIGGAIDKGEKIMDAMCREFLEETGIETHKEHWNLDGEFSGEGYRVYVCTTMVTGDRPSLPTHNDVGEGLRWMQASSLANSLVKTAPNLCTLLHLLEGGQHCYFRLFDKAEK